MDSKAEKIIVSFIQKLQLPQDQLEIIEDYITGVTADEALEMLDFKDLSSFPNDHSFSVAMSDLMYKEYYNEARMLFNIVFAIAKCSCYQIMLWIWEDNRGKIFDEKTLYKYLAAYANMIGTSDDWLCSTQMKDLESFVAEEFRKALDCQYNTDEGKAVLLAGYFKVKYTNMILDGNAQLQIEEDDLPLLKEYEDIMLNKLEILFGSKPAPSALEEIKMAVHGDNIDKIRPLVHKNANITMYMMKLICGLSYLNFPISTALKNIVSLCIAINTSPMLTAVYEISEKLNINITEIGGSFDTLFGIDSKDYILWATHILFKTKNSKSYEILLSQMKTNKDIYLSIIDEGINDGQGDELERVNKMIEVAREKDPDLFKQIIASRTKDGNNKDMMIIADYFMSEISTSLSHDEMTKLKDYLFGKEPIDAIYPFADKMKMEYQYGERGYNLIESFKRNYGESEFTRRCAVIMLLSGWGHCSFLNNSFWHGNYFRQVMSDGERNNVVSVHKVEDFFDDFEKEGLKLEYQLSLLDIMDSYSGNASWKKYFTDTLRQIFTKYLKEKREETLSVFRNASALGRWFGITVMKLNPNENKYEILDYAGDSSKLVKELMLDTLSEQREWEEDIKMLLSAKKAAERELGVRVLLNWQSKGADYMTLFRSVLKKEKSAKVIALLKDALGET